MNHSLNRRGAMAAGLWVSCGTASAQATAAAPATPVPPPVRLRGTIEKIEGAWITLRERSGKAVALAVPDNLSINEVMPIAMSATQPGAFISTAALTEADGSLGAALGTGEGHCARDLMPQSTMTNATVSGLSQVPRGRELSLRYKDGEKKVVVPNGAPAVTYKPRDSSLIVIGTRIFGAAVVRDGVPTFTRLNIGRNGFAPPR